MYRDFGVNSMMLTYSIYLTFLQNANNAGLPIMLLYRRVRVLLLQRSGCRSCGFVWH